MKTEILIIISCIFAAIIILLVTYIFYIRRTNSKKHILKKAIDEARRIRMDAIAEAKIETAQIFNKTQVELEEQFGNLELAKAELNKRRDLFLKDLEKLNLREEQIISLENKNYQLQNELTKRIAAINLKLESIASITVEEARKTLFANVEQEMAQETGIYIKNNTERAMREAKTRATEIVLTAIEKVGVEVVNEKTTTSIEIPSSDIKGKIIGKEGRNIKAFEQYGGVDIIVDESPNRITVSSFNPIRREIAARALNALIHDGRIQPARIEEALILEEKKLEETIYQVGENTIQSLGIYDLNPELYNTIGKLKYRTSFGQSALQHCIEVARIAANIAAELNLDAYIALKAGLLHDIGKAVDFEQEGSHVVLGVKLLKKYDLDERIINAVEAHHDDVAKESVYAEIVSIADALSAARPGARNNNFEEFVARMDEIESKVKEIRGVKNVFALQAGRQIRVIVDPDVIDDNQMLSLHLKVKKAIETDNKIPGEIVITLIREKRMI